MKKEKLTDRQLFQVKKMIKSLRIVDTPEQMVEKSEWIALASGNKKKPAAVKEYLEDYRDGKVEIDFKSLGINYEP